jgi:hypothetical protein
MLRNRQNNQQISQTINLYNQQHILATVCHVINRTNNLPNQQQTMLITIRLFEHTHEEEVKLLTINSQSEEHSAHTLTVNSQSGNLEQVTSSDYSETKTNRNRRNNRSRKVNNETRDNNQTNTQSTGHVPTTGISARPSSSYPLANSRYGNRHVNKQQDSDQLTQSSGHVIIQSSNSHVTPERSQLISQSRGSQHMYP